MEGRRYSTGSSTAPVLQYPDKTQNKSPQAIMRKKRRFRWLQPVATEALSGTSSAVRCFVNRENSQKLQRFLLNYAYNIRTAQVLSGEV